MDFATQEHTSANGWREVYDPYLRLLDDGFHLYAQDDSQEYQVRGPMSDRDGIEALRILSSAPDVPWRSIDKINEIIDAARSEETT